MLAESHATRIKGHQRPYCAHAAELPGLTELPDAPFAFACGVRLQSFESPFEPELPLLIVLFVVFGSTIAGLLLVPPLPLLFKPPEPDIVPVADPLPAAPPPDEPPLDEPPPEDWARAEVASPRDRSDTAAIFANMICSFIIVDEGPTT